MLQAYKNVGETPLEMLDRLRTEKSELQDEILSYAGRLDPMAEGEMLVLVGKKENQEAKKHFGYDKEYIATFLVDISTDTGDALGLITSTKNTPINRSILETEVDALRHITQQTYPWFSGKTVNGVKLFDHFKAGNTDIERPTQHIEVRKSQLISEEQVHTETIHTYIHQTIQKVSGDFRQKDVLQSWEQFFSQHTTDLHTFNVHFYVSGGTFIRGFTENFSFPCCLLKLKRTKIHTKKNRPQISRDGL